MLVNTKGIVLHKTKYSDHSLIVKIYTEKLGTQNFIINNAFGKKSKFPNSLFAPLAFLELVFDKKNNASLVYPKDISVSYHFQLIPFDMVRNSVLIFYNELLYKLLFDAGEDTQLFHFLEDKIMELDDETVNLSVVNILFLIQLSNILGFYPENNYSSHCCYFSVDNSNFQTTCIPGHYYLSKESSFFLSELMNNPQFSIPEKKIRKELLYGLTEYFKIHNEHIKKIESIAILSSLLN